MDDSQHIFDRLAEHQQQPPAELYSKILTGIGLDAPAPLETQLDELKETAIVPPVSLYDRIRKDLFLAKPGVLSYLIKYRVAAAIVLIAFIATVLVYQLNNRPHTAPPLAGTKIIVPVTSDDHDTMQKIDHGPGKIQLTRIGKPTQKQKTTPVKNNGAVTTELPFIDNDLLTSLTECADCNFAAYYSGKKKFLLNLGPYSSITVSGKMSAFMQTLYSTNRRNKPTPRARRAKKTLERWKKKDAANFDTPGKTALDPIDLVEFIIDNN